MNLKSIGEVTRRCREPGKVGVLPYIEIGDINILTKEYLHKEKSSIKGCLLARMGNILISRVRPTRGAVSLVRSDNICVSSAFTVLEPLDEKMLLYTYLFYSIAYNKKFYNYMERMQKGTSYPSCKEADILRFQIPIPPVSEQKRIVGTLEKADNLRRKHQDTVTLNNGIIRSIFYDMFGDYLSSKCSAGAMSLGEGVDINRPLVDPRKKEYQHLPHINGEVIEGKSGVLLKYGTVQEERLVSNKYIFEDTDVLYNKIRPYLCKATIPHFRGLCSADMYPITPNVDMILPEYLLWLLLSNEFTKYAIKCSTRARMPKLNRTELFGFRTSLPPISEQQKFADLVRKVERVKEKQQESKNELDNLFNSLMRKVFEDR